MNTIGLTHSALLLIEFQNEWLKEEGKLHHLFTDKTQFLDSLKQANRVIKAARTTPIAIIHSGLAYTSNYQELGQADFGLRKAIPMHRTFLKDSSASEFHAPFIPQQNEFTVSGRIGSSAFAGSNLETYLRNNQIRTLYIMGYALHVCVESTLRAAHDLGFNTFLIEDACATFTAEQKKYVLNDIVHHFGCRILASDFIHRINKKEEINT